MAVSRGPNLGRPREHDRLDELVRDTDVVARPNRGDGIVGSLAFSETDRAERAVRPLVAAVAIHRVVPAADRGNPFGRKLGDVVRGRTRRDVTSIRERVDPRPVRHALVLGQREQRAEVIHVRVHPAVGDEPEKMNVSPTLAGPFERGGEGIVLGERAVGDGGVHTGEILEEDPPGADREVTDLGVPHLTAGEVRPPLPTRRACRAESASTARRTRASARARLRSPAPAGRCPSRRE